MDEWLTGPSGVRVKPHARAAFVDDQPVTLTKTLFDVLVTLLRNRGDVVHTEDLVREVWGFEAHGNFHFAHTAVYRLRKQLRDAGAPDVVESVRGVGFRVPDQGGDQLLPGGSPAEITLRAAATAIMVIDDQRQILWANPAATELLGYPLEELRALASTADLSPPEQRSYTQGVWEAVRSGEHHRGNRVELVRRDGQRIEAAASWQSLRGGSGAPTHFLLEFWALDDAASRSGSPSAGRRVRHQQDSHVGPIHATG